MKNTFAAALLAPLLVVAVPVLMTPDAQAQTAQALPDFADLAEKAGPAVVNIRTTARVAPSAGALPFPDIDENDPMYEFFRRFFPNPPQQGPRQGPPGQGQGPGPRRDVPRGLGSGFILSADGYVLTNAHVVEGADDITVTLTDRREFKGKVIGADRRTDVALVKIEASALPTVKVGDPNRLRVGEWVVAIGSPFGLENTVTAGIVSAKARETGEFLPFIQTDVAVNPGNSGGPLLNMRGEVIGINSQIFTTSGGYNGISFAIPIDEAMNVQQQLRSSGRVIRGRQLGREGRAGGQGRTGAGRRHPALRRQGHRALERSAANRRRHQARDQFDRHRVPQGRAAGSQGTGRRDAAGSPPQRAGNRTGQAGDTGQCARAGRVRCAGGQAQGTRPARRRAGRRGRRAGCRGRTPRR